MECDFNSCNANGKQLFCEMRIYICVCVCVYLLEERNVDVCEIGYTLRPTPPEASRQMALEKEVAHDSKVKVKHMARGIRSM